MDPHDLGRKRFARSDSIVSRTIAGEVILVPIRRTAAEIDGVYTLNEVAARIWELLEGERTLDEIRACILDEYDVAPEDVERDLVQFLAQLGRVNAVREL
jgi:hypothetical protein